MGASMCGHLLAKGNAVTLHPRTRAKAEPLVARGAAWADSPRAVAEASDVVFTMLGFPDRGARGLSRATAGWRRRRARARSSSTCRRASRRWRARSPTRPPRAAPSPSTRRSRAATSAPARRALSIMVGGDEARVAERCEPLLAAMGKTIVRQGGPGAGQHTKMVNQILIASGMIGVCEALLYAHRAGLDADEVLSRWRRAPPARGRCRTTVRASSPATSSRASSSSTSSRTWASRWPRRAACSSRCRGWRSPRSSTGPRGRTASGAKARTRCCSRSRMCGVDPALGVIIARANDEERDRHVLAGDRDERQRVEDLVVAEDRGRGIGAAAGVHDRARRVGDAPASRSATAAGPAVDSSWGSAATPTQPSATAITTESHFGECDPAELRERRGQRAGPDDREHGPLQDAVEAQQADRRVGARDQHVDAGVVDPPHPESGARPPADAVVERARGEHRGHGAREGGGADRGAATVGADDQERPDDQSGAEADLVRTPRKQRPRERGVGRVGAAVSTPTESSAPGGLGPRHC